MTLKTLMRCVERCLIALTLVAEAPGFGPGSFAVASGGASYYVDAASGSDSNNGSLASPWKYLDTSVVKLSPGDTLYLRGGTYNLSPTNSFGGLYLETRNGDDGAAGAIKTVKAYPGETPTVNMQIMQLASYWRWEGIAFTGDTNKSVFFYVRPHTPWDSIPLPANNTAPMGHELTPGMDYSWPHDIQIVGNTFKGVIGTWDGVIHTYGNNILIENNDLTQVIAPSGVLGSAGNHTTGIYVSAGDNIVVRGNRISGPSDYITEIYDERRSSAETWTRWITNVTVENNTFYNPPGGLIAADGLPYTGDGVEIGISGSGFNITVRNNIVYNTRDCLLQLDQGFDNVKIYNNTLFQPASSAPAFSTRAFNGRISTRVSVENNIFDLGANYATTTHVNATSAFPITLNNNLYYPGPAKISGTIEQNPMLGDPLFKAASTDPASTNFHLQAGSAAIDKGLTLAADVPGDKDGVCRPQGAGFDIGAYEFCASGSCPATCGSGSGVIVNVLAPAPPRGFRLQ